MNYLPDYRKLGSFCINQGKQFLYKATPIKKMRYSASQILTAVRNITGLAVDKLYSADSYHDTTNIETWKTLIEDDWIDRKEYISEIFDCDNYAGSFTSHMAEIYLLNSAGRLTVELRDAVTDKHIGYHRCVLIVDDKLDCYLLESQDDRMIKMIGGRFIIGNWRYVPCYYDLN